MKTFSVIFTFSGLALVFLALNGVFEYRFKAFDPGPVQSFENHCASCHGPQGSFYGEGFGSKTHADLKHMVEEMMHGPAFLTPEEYEVEAMTAYHHALDAGEPFICITHFDSTKQTLSGEVILQDHFYMQLKNGKKQKIPVDSAGCWETAMVPGGIVVATKDSATTKLNFKKHQWSHKSLTDK
jgi:hypothetical protein